MTISLRRVLVAFVLVAAACGGGTSSTVETGARSQPASGDQPCVPGQSIGCGGPNGCSGYQVCADDGMHYLACDCTPSPPPPPVPADAGVDAAAEYAARCHAPDGQPLTFASIADVPPQLAGQWWLCGGAAEFFYPVEFTADGHWYKLTLVDGAFQRNLGPESSGDYAITAVDGIKFDMTFSSAAYGSCCGYPFYGNIQVSPPGKMRLGGGDYLRLP
jgi:hypothetical protein